MRRAAIVTGPLVLLLCHSAAAEILQYSLAPNPHPTLQLRWQDVTGRDKDHSATMVAEQAGVELRLQIPPRYTSPPALVRIYLNVPASIPGLKSAAGFEVSWEGQQRFLSGSARPGQRVLLYDGRVDSSVLSDVMQFRFTVDAVHTTGGLSFEADYEIEEK